MAPSYFEEDDIVAILDDCPDSVDVTIGSDTTKGLRDVHDQEVLPGQAIGAHGKLRTVLVKTGTLPGLAAKAEILVEDETFAVVGFDQVGDGAMTAIRVREV